MAASPTNSTNSKKPEYKAKPDEKAELTLVSEHFEEGFNNTKNLSTDTEKLENKAKTNEKAECTIST